jgi:hypothetical protein
MAGDIVKQLLDTRYPHQMEMRREAADEIERLRRELDHWKAVACDCLETREPSALSPSDRAENSGEPPA